MRRPTVMIRKKKSEFIHDEKLKLPVFDESQIEELFNARCADL